MSSQSSNLKRQEESCTHRYKKEIERINDEEESISKVLKTLKLIEEQLVMDATKACEHFDDYAHTSNPRLYQLMGECQNEINFSLAHAQRQLGEQQEELAHRQKKLSIERVDRDKQYKEELRSLQEKKEADC